MTFRQHGFATKLNGVTPARDQAARATKIAGIFCALLLLNGCNMPNRLDMPPVTDEATGTHVPGKVVWHDLLTDDVQTARDFYGALFGWSFEQRKGYTVILRDQQRIGGMAEVQDPSGNPHAARWLATFSVADVDAAVDFIEASGGKVHEGPATLNNRGRMAFVSDPQGAQLILIRTDGGDPEDQEPGIDDWLWNELWTLAPASSVAFYQTLGDYTAAEELDNYWLLKTGEQWRAGVRRVFDETLEQRWVPVIRVADPAQTATRSAELGGQIIIDARDGKAALLVDPAGALFMVQAWQSRDEAMERLEQ